QLGYNPQQIADSVAKESAKSIEYFTRSLSIFPALPSDGYNQLGKAYFNRGNLDSALTYYMRAYKEDSTNGIFINNIGTVYYNRGMALLSQQKPQEAVPLLMQSFPYFRRAHDRDTTESDFMNNIGCVYGTLNQPDSAIYWFEKALAKDSLDLTSVSFLSMTWKTKGDSAKAFYYQQKADAVRRIKTEQIRQ
ncbi:MAG: tetratricopeptide repeat protein, partial [Chitinophagaceae bacterium]|nr:tetratricopeptide repeat protein [Chitinophagaceae bacterium]